MEFLWLLMPIGCIVMMTIGRRSNESDRGGFHHQPNTSEDQEQTSDDLERFSQALQRRASAAGLSPEDTERLRRILNATADQETGGHGAPLAHQDDGSGR